MKKSGLLLLLLTLVNAALFFFRDSLQYIKYSTYNELYGDSGKGKWDDFLLAYPEASLKEGRQLLQPLQLDTASTLSTIRAIGNHLYTKFNKQAGYPQDALHRATPLDCYKTLSADTTQKVWCGTYAVMFCFLCWSQNIVCRTIEIFKPGDHHMLNECWVPELKQWVMVDVTNNLIGVEKNNTGLNMQDFVKAVAQKDSLFVLSAETMEYQPFKNVAQRGGLMAYYKSGYPFYYYHLTQPAVVYRPVEKLKRYFLPDNWYEIFSLQPQSNLLFWAKPVFAGLWLLLASLMAIKKFIK